MWNDLGLAAIAEAMYATVVPPHGYDVVQDGTEMRAHYARTGFVPVVDIAAMHAPLFDADATYYKLMAWIQYREFSCVAVESRHMTTFDLLVNDVLRFNRENTGVDASRLITILDALVNVTKEYDAKFKHQPVNLDKFVASFLVHGRASVLRADIY